MFIILEFVTKFFVAGVFETAYSVSVIRVLLTVYLGRGFKTSWSSSEQWVCFQRPCGIVNDGNVFPSGDFAVIVGSSLYKTVAPLFL